MNLNFSLDLRSWGYTRRYEIGGALGSSCSAYLPTEYGGPSPWRPLWALRSPIQPANQLQPPTHADDCAKRHCKGSSIHDIRIIIIFLTPWLSTKIYIWGTFFLNIHPLFCVDVRSARPRPHNRESRTMRRSSAAQSEHSRIKCQNFCWPGETIFTRSSLIPVIL